MTQITPENILQEIKIAWNEINILIQEIHKKVVWQDELIKNMIIALLANWHILLEWVPWLAKTLTIDTFSKALDLWFSRVQFTPDLLPSDLVWTEIFNPKTWEFSTKLWPIFNNFVLADEINRAPSKVQSALLEAMAERQITLWWKTHFIPQPFIVLATQNPLEQSWTYKLPEAQLDRFLIKTIVNYPSKQEEIEMYKKINSQNKVEINKVFDAKRIFEIQNLLQYIHISQNIYDYVYSIIDCSRNPEKYNLKEIKNMIEYWISPRWWLAILSVAKVLALMEWRDFVLPEDIKKWAFGVFEHRIILSYEALASNLTAKDIIKNIIENVEVV